MSIKKNCHFFQGEVFFKLTYPLMGDTIFGCLRGQLQRNAGLASFSRFGTHSLACMNIKVCCIEDILMTNLRPLKHHAVHPGGDDSGIRGDWILHVPYCKASPQTYDCVHEAHVGEHRLFPAQ
jgi:hypothetical protein